MENNKDTFINKVLSILELPYFKSLDTMGIDDIDTQKLIFSKLFNEDLRMGNNSIFDSNGNEIYYEDSDGDWVKYEYDSNGKRIYSEYSNGDWSKREYDSNGNLIYFETSDELIRDNRPGNINESEDRQELFINKVLSILELPYFKSLDTMGIDDIDTQKLILSKLFNDDVSIRGNTIYDSNGNEIYYEDSDGDWYKSEYDSNGNIIYYETSYGYWSKREYDSNGNLIYFETSDELIRDNRPGNINESLDKQELFVNRALSILELPYFKSLDSMFIDDRDTQILILSKLFNDDVSIRGNTIYDSNGNEIYFEKSNGEWYKQEYDSNDNIIYSEDSNGDWSKREYDSNRNKIYFENSDGYWNKREYDINGNEVYYESSNGIIRDNRSGNINESEDKQELFVNRVLSILELPYFKSLDTIGIDDEDTQKLIFSKLFNEDVIIGNYTIYDSNGNIIYYENSNGNWDKAEYDSNGNIIYLEDSSGDWSKREYDINGNEIYYENSYGGWVKQEYDLNDNIIYYEDSDGEWSKYEYDSNGNEIYFENSNGIIDDNRPNNINESLDKQELFVNKVLSILELPYFKSLDSIGIDDEDTQKLIFSKLFNDNVSIKYNEYIYDSNGNEVYFEKSNGYWYKTEYNSNGNRIYYEDSDGVWVKQEYDSNGNRIYFEDSDGVWSKREYDINGNEIYYENSYGGWEKYEYDLNGNRLYYEDSSGFWSKSEYDSNNNVIYYEDSDGIIRDNRSGSININESEDRQELFVNRALSILDKPYFKSLDSMGIDDEDTQKLIFSKLFNEDVIVGNYTIYDSNRNRLYYEDSDGYWYKHEYDSNGNIIYLEDSSGVWSKYEYDINGNVIYFENSDGYWKKLEYDSNGNKIYFENSNGEWEKQEYDSNGNEIYFEDSSGYWVKQEYDSNGREIYYENSDGKWYKREFDINGNEVYYESSNGIIRDNRSGNNINESEDRQELFVNRVLSILELPYFKSLDTIGIDDINTQELIFSKLFNDDDDVIIRNNTIYDSNGNRIYFENFSGDWYKQEFDSNGNIIYYEDSDGGWYKQEFDSNGNKIYFENSNGEWEKLEYDSNGNEIYFEDSSGYWVKQEYDSNGREIYYENSDGRIYDYRSSNNINESEDKQELFVNRVLSILELPYFKSLDTMFIDDIDTQKLIFSKLFNDDVSIESNRYGYVIHNSNDKIVYVEDSDGFWSKYEYDVNDKLVNRKYSYDGKININYY